jgi:hypothetical protein
MNLNIKSLAASETDTFQLRNGDDELLWATDALGAQVAVTVTVYGPGSKEYQKAQAKASNRAVERLRKRGKFEQTAEEKLREQAEHLADITAGFSHLELDDLQGRDLALAIYRDPQLGFIAEQVNKHAGDWANFTKGSPKS